MWPLTSTAAASGRSVPHGELSIFPFAASHLQRPFPTREQPIDQDEDFFFSAVHCTEVFGETKKWANELLYYYL